MKNQLIINEQRKRIVRKIIRVGLQSRRRAVNFAKNGGHVHPALIDLGRQYWDKYTFSVELAYDIAHGNGC